MKITVGNAYEKLKMFMYLTNEYGKPSNISIDMFIDTFGKIIRNGNFYTLDLIELDSLWDSIENDAKNHGTKALYQFGRHFYWQLSKDMANIDTKLNDTDEYNQKLKQYIMEFNINSLKSTIKEDYLLYNRYKKIPDIFKGSELTIYIGEHTIQLLEDSTFLCNDRKYNSLYEFIRINKIGNISIFNGRFTYKSNEFKLEDLFG